MRSRRRRIGVSSRRGWGPGASGKKLAGGAGPAQLAPVARSVQREPAREVGKLLSQNQSPSMETRLERLILHVKHRARLFSRHPLDIAQHDGRAIDGRQREDRAEYAPAQLRPEDALV